LDGRCQQNLEPIKEEFQQVKGTSYPCNYDPSKRDHYDKTAQVCGQFMASPFVTSEEVKKLLKLRVDFYTLPEMFIGGHGNSRVGLWTKQSSRSSQDYWKELDAVAAVKYFIYGPDLPKAILEYFPNTNYDPKPGEMHISHHERKGFWKVVKENIPHCSASSYLILPYEFQKLGYELTGCVYQAQAFYQEAKTKFRIKK
jgi:hypothetical protein